MIKSGIKNIRESLGLTQKEFGALIDKKQTTVANYESGIRSPDVKTAYKVIEVAKKHGKHITLEDVFQKCDCNN